VPFLSREYVKMKKSWGNSKKSKYLTLEDAIKLTARAAFLFKRKHIRVAIIA
jgi:hypothetical protein